MGPNYKSFLDVLLLPKKGYSYFEAPSLDVWIRHTHMSSTFYVFSLVWHSSNHPPYYIITTFTNRTICRTRKSKWYSSSTSPSFHTLLAFCIWLIWIPFYLCRYIFQSKGHLTFLECIVWFNTYALNSVCLYTRLWLSQLSENAPPSSTALYCQMNEHGFPLLSPQA